MYVFIFVVAFGVNVALAIYLAANAKTHAQPWRFFAIALITIFLAYGFEVLPGLLQPGATAADPALPQLAKLVNLICGAFSGALLGAAISNRAKHMHDAETATLKKSLCDYEQDVSIYLNELKGLFGETTDPGDAALQEHKRQAVLRVLGKLEDRRDEVRKKLEGLGVTA